MTDEQERIIYELRQLDRRLKIHEIKKSLKIFSDGTDFLGLQLMTT